MKAIAGFCIVALLLNTTTLLGQKVHVDIYKDGQKAATDSTRRTTDMARLQAEMIKTQHQLDSLGKQLSKLYTDSALFVLKYNQEQFEKMTADMHTKLDALVKRMENDRDIMTERHYTFTYPPKHGDSSVLQIGRYKVVIRGNDTLQSMDMPPLPTLVPPCLNQKYTYKTGGFKWAGVALGFNGLLDNYGNTSSGAFSLNNYKSAEVQIALFKQYFNITQHHVYFNYGATLTLNNYRLPNDVMLVPRQPVLTTIQPDVAFKKNKLSVNWVDVPLAIRYESNAHEYNRSFHLEAGVYGGYRFNTHAKQVKDDGTKVKQWDNFNLNDFRYGTTLTIGYGKVSLYATYTVSNYFKHNEGIDGAQYHPFSFGVVLNHI